MTVEKYKTLSETKKFKPPIHNHRNVEKLYWANITEESPLYGADVLASVIDKDVNVCI